MGRSKGSGRRREDAPWRDEARRLAGGHAEYGSLARADLRRCLAELWRLVATVPRDIGEAYKTLSEADLATHSRHCMGRMMDGDFDWAPDSSAVRDWALAVGGQLRAYDSELLRLSQLHCGPVLDPAEWYCPDENAYVVPRRRASRATGGAGHNNSLARRGLVHHRILPARVGGDAVDIVIVGDLSPRGAGTSSCRIGCASFSALTLDLDTQEDGQSRRFRAVTLAGNDTAGTVERHVGLGFEQGCLAVVWPELAMPPALRDGAVAAIARRRLAPCPTGRPRLWITGSWHERNGAEFVNRCRIYDRDGCLTSVYDKMSRYHHAAIGFEDIAIGARVPVIVTDEVIVGVAICKDFCMLDSPSPGRAFPVDLVLVPSFGDEATAQAHVSAAHQMAVDGGASCVVQQMSGRLDEIGQDRIVVAAPAGLMLAHGSGGPERRAATDGWSLCVIGLR